MRLLLDEDLSPKIAELLRKKGIDAVSVHEVGRIGLSDKSHLEYAASERRCFVTRNRNDYIILTRQFFSSNKPHKGVLIIPSSHHFDDFSAIAKAITKYAAHYDKPIDYLFDFV